MTYPEPDEKPVWFTLLVCLLSFIALCVIGHFILQQPPHSSVWKPTNEAKVPGVKDTILDIEQHYWPWHDPASTYRSSDKVTWAHELTHGVNSGIRHRMGWGFYDGLCVYALGDVCYTFTTPRNCTLTDVRDHLKWKGRSYGLYFGSQIGEWNKQPLYHLDELQAYTNGTTAGLEEYGPDSRTKSSWDSAMEFNYYCRVALDTVAERDPTYQELDKLKTYLDLNYKYLKSLEPLFNASPPQ